MAKPIKNRVWCPGCRSPRMLFQTEKEAERFIKFNGSDIIDNVSKLRVYFCEGCGGYHITSHAKKDVKRTGTQNIIVAYKKVTGSDEIKIVQEPKPDIDTEKLTTYITKIYDEFFRKGGHQEETLGKYIKWNYGDKLSGIERDWLFKKLTYSHDIVGFLIKNSYLLTSCTC